MRSSAQRASGYSVAQPPHDLGGARRAPRGRVTTHGSFASLTRPAARAAHSSARFREYPRQVSAPTVTTVTPAGFASIEASVRALDTAVHVRAGHEALGDAVWRDLVDPGRRLCRRTSPVTTCTRTSRAATTSRRSTGPSGSRSDPVPPTTSSSRRSTARRSTLPRTAAGAWSSGCSRRTERRRAARARRLRAGA